MKHKIQRLTEKAIDDANAGEVDHLAGDAHHEHLNMVVRLLKLARHALTLALSSR